MDTTQIILIVFIVLLIIIYPILISTRNKKENQRMQEQTNSLKRGDRVLTTSGVYGTIVDLHLEEDKKIVTIETGTGKNKGYISVDAYAIYTVFKDEEEIKAEENKDLKIENKEDKKDTKLENKVLDHDKTIESENNDQVSTETKKNENSDSALTDNTDENSASTKKKSLKVSKKKDKII